MGNHKPSIFIIAEFGMLHDGSFGNALRMVEVAKLCGADAVKFQTHIPEAETLPNAPMPSFFKGEPRWQYFQRTAFTLEQWKQLKAHCDDIGIEFMSSPFSIEAVDLLEQVGMQRYKIPSGEVTNIPFLERVAETKKPVLLSSGMSSWDELDAAVSVFQKGCNPLTVLQCTSIYPTPPEKVGLNVLLEMKQRYKVPVGLSDQSLTNNAGFAAAALEVEIIEKHITLSRQCYGSDAKHSIEPAEFAEFVRGIREIETMLTHPVDKNAVAHELREMKHVFEKSVVSLVKISAGTVITQAVIGIKKPGGGIAPRKFRELIGRKVTRDVEAGQVLVDSDINF